MPACRWGEGTKTDVSQAQAQLAAAQAQLAAAVAQQKIAEATYMQIVGEEPKGIALPPAAKRGMPASLDKAVAWVCSSIRRSSRPSMWSIPRAIRSRPPRAHCCRAFAVQGSVGRSYGSPSSASNPRIFNSASVTAQLTIPIYKGGAEYGACASGQGNDGANQIKVDSARLSVRQSIVSAYAQMQAASASISANKQAVSASNLALSGVIEERNVGQATTLDVLNSQQTVLTAKLNLAQAQHDLVVAATTACWLPPAS